MRGVQDLVQGLKSPPEQRKVWSIGTTFFFHPLLAKAGTDRAYDFAGETQGVLGDDDGAMEVLSEVFS